MIGAEEFRYRGSSNSSRSTGDLSDMEYIETFLVSRGKAEGKKQLLIDIVCPQPQSSKKRGSVPSTNGQQSLRAARTNSTSGWRK
jgi:hypothetical protein